MTIQQLRKLAPESLLGDLQLEVMMEMAAFSPPGCFVEVGVYKGGSAWFLAKIAKQQGRELYLYDTFTGIPHRHRDYDPHHIGDFAETSFEAVCDAIPMATVVMGVFPHSLTRMPPVAFAHIDADQYQSVKDAITTLKPLMVEGGIMLFDDVHCLPGADIALYESGLVTYDNRAGKAFAVF